MLTFSFIYKYSKIKNKNNLENIERNFNFQISVFSILYVAVSQNMIIASTYIQI